MPLLYFPSPKPASLPSEPSVNLPSHWHPDIAYIRALSECSGFGGATISRLLAKIGSLKALWNAPDAFLRQNLAEAKRLAFLQRRDQGIQEEWLDNWQAKCEHWRATPIGFTDEEYPPSLKEIAQFPTFLYLRGSREAVLAERQLAVVGTRKMSDYGRKVTHDLIRDLAPARPCIVSGLASGIDTEAHAAALQIGLPTVAVFGCGLDIIYPQANRGLAAAILSEGGALLSECEFGVAPTRHSFPRRNRIVAGLCQGTVVIEGDLKSGAMITARFAMEEGRTVFALPGRITDFNSQGPLTLLQQGATPLLKASDIALDLGWGGIMTKQNEGAMIKPDLQALSAPKAQHFVEVKAPSVFVIEAEQLLALSEEERQVLNCLTETPITLDALSQKLAWPMAQISERLTMLELEGFVSLLPGARVSRSLKN